MDQDIPKVNSHHPIFYGAPVEPKVHFFVFISPISRLPGHHVLDLPIIFSRPAYSKLTYQIEGPFWSQLSTYWSHCLLELSSEPH